ncbi:MAG: VOC family protein [Oscillospiraceae bacterium]|nr:VOC family protein [Oscillospiraceae bacterium]MBR6657714.1 VOC family protein [Oscillospiraceae bacterium]
MNLIHHIAIICSDKNSAMDFYVKKLGFPVVRENYRPERDDWKIDLKINEDTELELFIMKGHPERLSPESYGLRHIAFKVDDVDSAVKEFEAKGIICEPVRMDEFTGKKATFFKDPDGLPLEIHE